MATFNFKNISTSGFDEDALTASAAGERIFNFGDLTTTGDLANGVFAGFDNFTLRNFGHLETSGLGAAGIFVNGTHARVENFGSIVTHGDFYDPDPNIDGDEFFSEGITVNGDGFYIANYGSVHVEGVGSSALVGAGAHGTIINRGVVDSSSIESLLIAALGDGSQVINSGRVISSGDDTSVLALGGQNASALNSGEILVSGVGSIGMLARSIDLEFNPVSEQLTNTGVIRVAGDESFGMGAFGDGHQVSNYGLIETHGTLAVGIAARGGGPLDLPGLNTEVVNAGRIVTEGDLAMGIGVGVSRFGFLSAVDDEVVNRGVVETSGDGAAGVALVGDGHHLTNSGRITASGGAFDSDTFGFIHAAGVLVSGDAALVENTRTGIIASEDAASAAVELNVLERDGVSNSELTAELDNFGLISSPAVAVLGGAGAETVVNHGRIIGDVMLGDGDDTFVFDRGGVLNGELFLGGGEDLVRVEDGSRTSRIADFAPGDDVIDVSAFFTSFDQLAKHSHQSGTDVVITLDHNDTLVLEHLQVSALTANEFLFA